MKHIPIDKRTPPDLGGIQEIYRFDNGYGASVVQHRFSYGGDNGFWELAVIIFDGPNAYDWSICYDTGITSDVLGNLSRDEVDAALDQIAALPRCRGGQEGGGMICYVPFQLADDEATYGPDAGKFIVTTADLETELTGPMSENDARTLSDAMNACQMVVDRWEKGDLAEAARACGNAVAMAAGRADSPELPPIVIEVRGGCVVDVTGLPPGIRYEIKDWDNLEADEKAAGRAA